MTVFRAWKSSTQVLVQGKKNQNTWHQKSLSAFVDINIVFYYHLTKRHDLTTKRQVHREPSEKMWVIR